MRAAPVLGALLCLVASPVASHAATPEADAILGTWRTEDRYGNRDAIVEIQRAAPGSDEFVAKIVWVKYEVYPPEDPKGMVGQPVVDRENPDPALRKRPLLGVEMLYGLRFAKGAWRGGEIYSPREGSIYNARVTLADPNTLEVRGYLGTPMLGKTVRWTREALPAPRQHAR